MTPEGKKEWREKVARAKALRVDQSVVVTGSTPASAIVETSSVSKRKRSTKGSTKAE